MGYFASRNGAFCNTKKHPLNRSHWYSIYYKSLSYFAYLRPMRVLSANTHLFFGVESETNREKSKSGYNLKPGHIVSFHHQETTPIRKKINLTTVHLLSFHPNKTTLILDLRQCFLLDIISSVFPLKREYRMQNKRMCMTQLKNKDRQPKITDTAHR